MGVNIGTKPIIKENNTNSIFSPIISKESGLFRRLVRKSNPFKSFLRRLFLGVATLLLRKESCLQSK